MFAGATEIVYSKGYVNDTVVPVTSSFLDFSKHDGFLEQGEKNSDLFSDASKKSVLFSDFVFGSSDQYILYSKVHNEKVSIPNSNLVPVPPVKHIRFFKDYTHTEMASDVDFDDFKDDSIKQYRKATPYGDDIEVTYPLFDTIRYDLENIYEEAIEKEGHAQISGDILIEPYPVGLNQDFKISFTLKEVRGAPKRFEELKIEILDNDDNVVFDFANFVRNDDNNEEMMVSAFGTLEKSETNKIFEDHKKGRYKIRIKGKTSSSNEYFTFDAIDGGINPKEFVVISTGDTLEGYASIADGVHVTPIPVALNRDFRISFTLREINGIEKVFEELAIVILDSNNEKVFDFAKFSDVTIPASGTLSQTARNKIFESHPTGTYQVLIQGKNSGGDWFDIDEIDGGKNYVEFPVIKSSYETSNIDLVFIIDTTGSMGDDISEAKASALDIVDEIATQTPDFRIAVVTFEDFPYSPYGNESCGDYMYHDIINFTNDVDAIVSAIQSIELRCGGDGPESHYSAMMHCFQKNSLGGWRDGVNKSAILITDAPPHDPEPETGYTYQDVIDASEALDPVVIYPIMIGNYFNTEAYLKLLAEGTHGRVIKASSSNDVVDSISKAVRMATGSTATKQTVDENTVVTLFGSSSIYYDEKIVSVKWNLADKSPTWVKNIQLSDRNSLNPTFKAPEVGEDNGSLTFSLVLVDDSGETYNDKYVVEIINHGPGDENNGSSSCFINAIIKR